MAPSVGMTNKCTMFLLFAVLHTVPFCEARTALREPLTLAIPHNVPTGYTVLTLAVSENCTDTRHVHQNMHNTHANPFYIYKGHLVTNTSLATFIGDHFIIKQKTECLSVSNVLTPVSRCDMIQIGVQHSSDMVTFRHEKYVGSIRRTSPEGTMVEEISDLFACEENNCKSDVDYTLEGDVNDDLPITWKTVNVNGQRQVQIVATKALQQSTKSIYHFLLTAHNSNGLKGHTNVEIHILDDIDEQLRYVPQPTSFRRRKRSTTTITAIYVPESSTGILFTVDKSEPATTPPAGVTWTYSLANSSLADTFTVSDTGAVSLLPNVNLDYEDVNKRNPDLIIKVKVGDIDVKDLAVTIHVTDVNDELPQFSNKPSPYLATVSMSAGPGTLVYTLTAVDRDQTAQLQLRPDFTIDPTAEQYFSVVNTDAGGTESKAEIRKKAGPAFTADQTFQIRIIATDTDADPDQEIRGTVEIKVGTRGPQFMVSESPYNINFQENNEAEQIIGTIEVKSFQDQPVDFLVLDSQDQPMTEFIAVDRPETPGSNIKSCNIKVTQVMDYETPPRVFSAKILATETSSSLSSTTMVTFSVTDQNEFKPRFTISTYMAQDVMENAVPGTRLLTVTASDEDFGTTLTFSVGDSHFRIEAEDPTGTSMPQTAVIRIDQALDYDRISPKSYNFPIVVRDNGEIVKSGDATALIYMVNLNDESPVFPENMKADIRYDLDVGSEVYIARATDADEGDHVTYSMNLSPPFQQDGNSGRITLSRKIAELQQDITQFQYILQVIATDDGACCTIPSQPHRTTASVTINILTDNKNRPTFQQCNAYDAKVDEQTANAFVLKVTATDLDYGANGEVTYSILEPNSKFRINESTGEIFTNEEIDRETLAASSATVRIPVNVIATDGGGLRGTCSLLVRIVDINDNPPVFIPTTGYRFTVLRTRDVGAAAGAVNAKDADIGDNGLVQYSLVDNPGGYFMFDEVSKFTGDLKIAKALPQDINAPPIQLTVKAEDGGSPVLNTTTSVVVTLVNDDTQLPPVWAANTPTLATVAESVALGTNITVMSATSRTTNPTLIFSVVEDNATTGLFEMIKSELDPNTAFLQNRQLLDAEKATTYRIIARVSDITDRYTDRPITIHVTDVNDNKPYFLGTSETGALDVSVAEGDYTNSNPPKKVQPQLHAEDIDVTSPNNQILSYSIIGTTPADQMFTIDQNTGQLFTNSVFDREAPINIYSITVQATDNPTDSTQRRSGVVTVKITILDVNDNSPSFKHPQYLLSVNEDKDLGSIIDTVTAEDADSDAVLTYSLSSAIAAPFTVQPQTGDIKVNGPMDFDQGQTTYTMTLTVYDSKFSSSTEVVINLVDVNDNAPIVGNIPPYESFVENDTSIIGVIDRVTATDVDFGGTKPLYYKLSFTDPDDARYFSINENTGDLSIIRSLDRDLPNGKAAFLFTVEVTDAKPGDNPLPGYGTVTVRPQDINDNAPFFKKGNLKVPEEQAAGAIVGPVSVIDYDFGDNGTYTLQILSQLPADAFELTPQSSSNELRTTTKLDREQVDKYYVVMQAVDNGTPDQLTGTATLTISVEDINDNPPWFNETYSFTLSEAQTTGSVGVIRAYDNDVGPNAVLTYSLSSTEGLTYFRMDKGIAKNAGILNIFSKLDYDELGHRKFNLTATATDSGYSGPESNIAETTIEVIVTDYNDEKPIFDPRVQVVSLAENVEIGHSVATFTATDADVNPEWSKFKYFIARASDKASDPLHQFAIDDTSGVVTINDHLDRETTAIHTVSIIAIDNSNGMPQQTGTGTLSVTVTDINDNFPEFAPYQPPSITENIGYSNSILVQISAVDKDLPENGPPFTMSLDCTTTDVSFSDQCGNFSLDFNPNGDNGRGSASIKVSGKFDREKENVIKLPIKMCDIKGFCGIRLLPVTVLDENDNTHGPGYQDILVYNYKGLFGNIAIGQVNVEDPDDGNNDKTYVLVNADVAEQYVGVELDTGIITLKEGVPEMGFTFAVDVRDQKGNTQQSSVRVNVIYIDDDAVYNSGSVRLEGITGEEFLTKPKGQGSYTNYDPSMYDKFRQQLALKLYDSDASDFLDKVYILNVNHEAGTDYTDIRYSAHGSPWFQSSRLDGVVSNHRQDFTATLNGKGTIDMVPIDMCQFETCEGGCYNELIVENTPTLVNTKGASFVGVTAFVNGSCGCRATDFSSEKACTPGYCYHGGECVQDEWNVISCKCPAGYDGPRCQQLRQSFDGTGYALYRQLEQCEESHTSIDVLTKSPNGLILYNGPTAELDPTDPRDFISLELSGGYPVLRINQGTGERRLEIQSATRKKLDDGAWHTIDIFRKKKHIRMVVDHCDTSQISGGAEDRSACEVSGYTLGENIYINVATVLQLGGRFESPTYPSGVTAAKFSGCMRNLVHNSEIYDLSTGGNFPGAEDGCKAEDDACLPLGCENGQCLITGVDAQGRVTAICDCQAGRRTSTPGVCDVDTAVRDLRTQSFMDWKLKQSFKQIFLSNRRTSISFQFRTRDTNGTIFRITDEIYSSKFIQARVFEKYLRIDYNLGDIDNDLSLPHVTVNDGQWHTFKIDRFGKEFIIKLDGGEGRYYAQYDGPRDGATDLNIRSDQIYSGAQLAYSSQGVPSYVDDDFEKSCLNDIRVDYQWFPMTDDEEAKSSIATLENSVNTQAGCVRNDCTEGKCSPPEICEPRWGDHTCRCKDHFIRNKFTCEAVNYCDPNPCFGLGQCIDDNPCKDLGFQCTETIDPVVDYYTCKCPSPWYGKLCQCHPDLDPEGEACRQEESSAMASGVYVGIGLGILFLIAAAIVIIWLLCCRRKGEKNELLDDDPDEDIRENIMYYDEEGAGEEDQTAYDLSRLRKPDDGEHASPWDDRPDIAKRSVKPLGHSDRPDIGDFITTRLDDADDDPGSPPFDTARDFAYEGDNSDVGSLSSLNTSSSGDQDYDYLHNWGPKFAKLADMYNKDDDESD